MLLTVLAFNLCAQVHTAQIGREKPPVTVLLKNDTSFDFKYQFGGKRQLSSALNINPGETKNIVLGQDTGNLKKVYTWLKILDIDGYTIYKYQPSGNNIKVILTLSKDQQNKLQVQKKVLE
jgi:hypothetical protein